MATLMGKVIQARRHSVGFSRPLSQGGKVCLWFNAIKVPFSFSLVTKIQSSVPKYCLHCARTCMICRPAVNVVPLGPWKDPCQGCPSQKGLKCDHTTHPLSAGCDRQWVLNICHPGQRHLYVCFLFWHTYKCYVALSLTVMTAGPEPLRSSSPEHPNTTH